MSQGNFSQVNTALSVRETRFLTEAQFDLLLKSQELASRSQILQGAGYELKEEDLTNPAKIETTLMKELLAAYDWAFEVSPSQDLLSLFTLKYTYHNLKVYLKHKATERKLAHLLIPVGPYSLEVLEHLVATFSAEHCPAFMADEMAATWQEYQDYQDLRVLEIGMDLAYFKHLKQLQLDQPVLQDLVTLTIDFYNVITVKRALDQQKPYSFMHQLLSDEGSLSAYQVIELVEQGDMISWFNQVNPLHFDLDLQVYEDKMRSNTISTVELEYLENLLKWKILDQGRYETDGGLPLARYLYGRELEVKNLRLVLTGLDNQVPVPQIKERMRPIYGQ